MSEKIKLPDDLLLEIQNLQDELAQNVVEIGRRSVESEFHRRDLAVLESELKTLYDKAEDIQFREADLQQRVVSQYGNGKLDFKSGFFTKD